MEQITQFFKDLWVLVITKHNEGVYNSVCLGVLLTLPLLVLVTCLLVCCHCCCCCCCGDGCACCRRGDRATIAGSQPESRKKKKKNAGQKEEDLWISMKTGHMDVERLPFTVV